MPKHSWGISARADNGSGFAQSFNIFASLDQNIGGNQLGQLGLHVGAQDVERVALSVTVAHIVSFFIVADTDIRIRVNSELTPDQEFNLAAGQPLGWNNQAALQPVPSNPLLFDITSLYFFNKGTVAGVIPTGGLKTANINGSFLLTQETQTS